MEPASGDGPGQSWLEYRPEEAVAEDGAAEDDCVSDVAEEVDEGSEVEEKEEEKIPSLEEAKRDSHRGTQWRRRQGFLRCLQYDTVSGRTLSVDLGPTRICLSCFLYSTTMPSVSSPQATKHPSAEVARL
jgi:hypothetical protein